MAQYDNDPYGNPYVYGQEDFWAEAKKQTNPIEVQQGASQSSGGYSQTATSPFTPQQRDSVVQGWLKSSYGANTQGIKDYLGSLGAAGAGWTVLDDDKVRDPNQRVYDWIGDVNTDRAQKRSGYTTDTRYANVTGATTSAAKKAKTTAKPTAPVAPAPVAPPVQPAVSALSIEEQRKKEEDEALRQQLIAQLTQRAQQTLTIDRNGDPVIRAQADAYAANEERARRNYLADIAEQAGPLANLRGEQRLAAERVGQRTGAFEAELVGRELTARRAEIADALESMRGMLTTGQEMTLRKELALMDDAIKRLQIKNQSTQFGQNLTEQARQFNADLEFKNRQLAEQSKQAANQLGFNYDSFDWIRSPLNPANMPRE